LSSDGTATFKQLFEADAQGFSGLVAFPSPLVAAAVASVERLLTRKLFGGTAHLLNPEKVGDL
jgi:hypothetical protein